MSWRAPTTRSRRKAELIAEYTERFANPYIAAERGYVDDVIDPRDTRRVLVDCARDAAHEEGAAAVAQARQRAAVMGESRPYLQVVGPDATPDEVAAIVAAVGQALARSEAAAVAARGEVALGVARRVWRLAGRARVAGSGASPGASGGGHAREPRRCVTPRSSPSAPTRSPSPSSPSPSVPSRPGSGTIECESRRPAPPGAATGLAPDAEYPIAIDGHAEIDRGAPGGSVHVGRARRRGPRDDRDRERRALRRDRLRDAAQRAGGRARAVGAVRAG